jgi:diguanylate cyclase (GGDEF)-like protein
MVRGPAGESRLRRADGSLLDVWLSASCIYEERTGRPSHHARVFSDISRLKEQEQALAALARSDALTGLPNRRAFEERLGEALLRATRSGELLALVFLDLDGFKAVNDQLGHEAGDELLRGVAQRLKDCVRAMDLVCRLGGDEFTIVLEQVGSEAAARELCQRIVEALSLPHSIGGQGLVSTPSVGLAMAQAGESAQALLQRADLAMYIAKRAGKGRYVLADSVAEPPPALPMVSA